MLKTPLTVLLVLRCFTLLSVGDAGTVSSTAESTFESGSWTSADIVEAVDRGWRDGVEWDDRQAAVSDAVVRNRLLAGWQWEEEGELSQENGSQGE